jgi:arylformamidase
MEQRFPTAPMSPMDSSISMSVHAGTHIDTPFHFMPRREDISKVSFDALLGPCYVANLKSLSAVNASYLEFLPIHSDTSCLLLRTRNSDSWTSGARDFDPDFVALTPEATRWVVNHSIKLIGIDYLLIQRFEDGSETHVILLGAGVVVLEGLCLCGVVQGRYDLICLQIRLPGAEGA